MSAPLMHSSILLLLFLTGIAIAAPPIAMSNCKSSCGNVSIPYPFGIGDACSFNDWYNISCDENSIPSSPTILLTKIQMEVLGFLLPLDVWHPYVRIKSPVISKNCGGPNTSNMTKFTESPFFFSKQNIFVAAGCNNRALLSGIEPEIVGCYTSFRKDNRIFDPDRPCNGNSCCPAMIPLPLKYFDAIFEESKEVGESKNETNCKLAFLVEHDSFLSMNFDPEMQSIQYATALLNWRIDVSDGQNLLGRNGTSYCGILDDTNIVICECASGYEGNPYLPNGCEDIDECKDDQLNNLCGNGTTCVNKPGSYECIHKEDELYKNDLCGNGTTVLSKPGSFECIDKDREKRRKHKSAWVILGFSLGFGVLLLFIGGWWFYKLLKERKKNEQKKKFFKKNGGLLLQQQMFLCQDGTKKVKIFDSKELHKATDHFNKNRILGRSGQGAVYKGMLVDGQLVAVKRSIAMDADKVVDFINEVVNLSQINHRNVVKLLGCCLETEVPFLVYEFIPNGTLYKYLHDQTEDFKLSWEMRLKIAVESAEAISFLHSSASIPIYHRDIKSTNILLDEKYRAKVLAFGTSTSLVIDQMQGTLGYLVPEYSQSTQFTAKSDVYNFGVVLIELITGKEPSSMIRIVEEKRSLVTHFMLLMQKNRLFEVVDARVMHECVREEIIAVANVAYRCLNLRGKKLPTMKDVVIELGQIPSLQKGLNAQQAPEEHVITDHACYIRENASTSTSSTFKTTGAAFSLEMQLPFVCSQNT